MAAKGGNNGESHNHNDVGSFLYLAGDEMLLTDLGAGEYRELAMKVLKICRRYDVDCILHSRAEAARELGCPRIHLPFSRFCGDNICVKSGESERLSGSDERSRLLMDFDLIGVDVYKRQPLY